MPPLLLFVERPHGEASSTRFYTGLQSLVKSLRASAFLRQPTLLNYYDNHIINSKAIKNIYSLYYIYNLAIIPFFKI